MFTLHQFDKRCAI